MSNKNIIISGASGGLGRDVVKKLSDSGFALSLVVDKKDIDLFNDLPNQFSEAVDLLDEKASINFVQKAIATKGGVYGAVLLVGGYAPGELENATDADIRKMVDLNFFTAFHLVKPLLAHFEQQGLGQIILVGSKAALVASEGAKSFAYALSKSMVITLADMINANKKYPKVTASVIVPSTMDTPANRASMPTADYTKWVPTKDVAETIDFILSDAGSNLRHTVLKIYNES
ncbi:MAG TPA: SDR family NAD(P)-dependent oxidoreductase [Ferruginibacter sp.]|jgi:NAD(P)-dependent dehydrogenase (short-subunit alcohol dehydrogenase family)|nr:SDR family NAD(P)-dependent oxidoreductase [Ferruginibacter sp.]